MYARRLRSLRIPGTGLCAALALAAVALRATPASAHSFSIAYSDVEIAADRTAATVRLRINLIDLIEPLGLPGDAEPRAADIAPGADRLFAYTTARITLEGDGRECPPERVAVRAVEQTDTFAELTWRCTWPQPIATFAYDYDLFFDIDPNHTGMLKVTFGAEHASTPLTADASRFEWTLSEPPPAGIAGFLVSGVEHILYGPDHILFLLALLLAAALVGLRATIAIVTSFTAAHSITLIAAALGWIALPTRIVESAIAASIVWVAIENLLVERPAHRWRLSFAFGLIHGIGFARMLSPLLPDTQVLVPLLTFNVGVELGQLVIVATTYPILRFTAHRLDLARYRRFITTPGSILVGLVGLLWLLQRAFGL